MKKLLFLSLFWVFTSHLQGQTWFAPDYRWSFNLSGGFAGIDEDFEVTFEKDTTIHGLPCRKWVYQIPFPWAPYTVHNYTYSDGPRTYIYLPERDSLVKMYDFSLPVGSQIQVPRNTGVFTYQIEAIDQVAAGNLTLLRQYVRYINPNGQPSSWYFYILEKIGMVGDPFSGGFPGCAFVFLTDYECGSVVDGFDMKFLCFSSTEGGFFPNPSDCSLVNSQTPLKASAELFPNPAVDQFEILLPDPSDVATRVSLSDARGLRVKNWVNPGRSCKLDGLPAGVYFVEIELENGLKCIKKLQKW